MASVLARTFLLAHQTGDTIAVTDRAGAGWWVIDTRWQIGRMGP
jgi:hypothetical protein